MSRSVAAVLAAVVMFIPFGVAAQEDFKAKVVRVLKEARRFQQPRDALSMWGDPQNITGTMSPIMSFAVGRGRQGPNLWSTLWYAPPGKGSRRLEYVQVTVAPAPRDVEIVEWLGTPVRKEPGRFDPKERVLVYEGRDKLGLDAVNVTVPPDRSRAHFLFMGRPD